MPRWDAGEKKRNAKGHGFRWGKHCNKLLTVIKKLSFLLHLRLKLTFKMLGSLNVREMHVSMIKGTAFFLSFVQNTENMDMLPDVRRWIEGLRGSGEKDKEDKEAAAA